MERKSMVFHVIKPGDKPSYSMRVDNVASAITVFELWCDDNKLDMSESRI